MRNAIISISLLLGAAASVWGAPGAEPAKASPALPSPTDVQSAVQGFFKELPGYQPGGLVTRAQVAPLFRRLRSLGWEVADSADILAALPAPNDPIVRALQGPAGASFQKKLATIPQGYDYVARLLALPRGKEVVADLVQAPGGEAMIQYLSTTPGGKRTGAMLSRPAGHDFNQSTGRLYTAEDVAARLKASYTAARANKPHAAAAAR